MKLITELVEDVKYIEEGAEGGKKSLHIEGVFLQGALKNRNGRVYPVDVLSKEVNRYHEQYIAKNRAFGELGHPNGPTINLDRVSHMITSLKQEGNNFVGRAVITNTPMGEIVRGLMESGAQLGVSSRGMGSLKEVNGINEVQSDFYLATAADIVADPSAPDAFVNGIMEGVDWVWNNGVLKAQQVESYKKEVKKTSKKQLEEAKLRIFKHFLSNI